MCEQLAEDTAKPEPFLGNLCSWHGAHACNCFCFCRTNKSSVVWFIWLWHNLRAPCELYLAVQCSSVLLV